MFSNVSWEVIAYSRFCEMDDWEDYEGKNIYKNNQVQKVISTLLLTHRASTVKMVSWLLSPTGPATFLSCSASRALTLTAVVRGSKPLSQCWAGLTGNSKLTVEMSRKEERWGIGFLTTFKIYLRIWTHSFFCEYLMPEMFCVMVYTVEDYKESQYTFATWITGNLK